MITTEAAPTVTPSGSVAALLLLADGRFPDGSHAHSFGMEAAVNAGRVRDARTLHDYVETRLWTTTRTDAAAAALAADGSATLDRIDAALVLRMPGAAQRAASRSLGRSLARTADRLWPDRAPRLTDGRPPLQPVAFGAVATLAGCSPFEAALCTTHSSAAALANAALRLLGLDPFSVASVLADLRGAVDAVASSVTEIRSPDQLPYAATPFSEIDPELQRTIEPRLFGS
jgi:urease accessory protein